MPPRPSFWTGRQISYFAAPVFVTERLAAILKIYKRLTRKTKNLLNIIQKAAEDAKLKTSELPLTQFFSVCFIALAAAAVLLHLYLLAAHRCICLRRSGWFGPGGVKWVLSGRKFGWSVCVTLTSQKIKHADISGCVRCVQLCVFACLTVKVIVRSFLTFRPTWLYSAFSITFDDVLISDSFLFPFQHSFVLIFTDRTPIAVTVTLWL